MVKVTTYRQTYQEWLPEMSLHVVQAVYHILKYELGMGGKCINEGRPNDPPKIFTLLPFQTNLGDEVVFFPETDQERLLLWKAIDLFGGGVAERNFESLRAVDSTVKEDSMSSAMGAMLVQYLVTSSVVSRWKTAFLNTFNVGTDPRLDQIEEEDWATYIQISVFIYVDSTKNIYLARSERSDSKYFTSTSSLWSYLCNLQMYYQRYHNTKFCWCMVGNNKEITKVESTEYTKEKEEETITTTSQAPTYEQIGAHFNKNAIYHNIQDYGPVLCCYYNIVNLKRATIATVIIHTNHTGYFVVKTIDIKTITITQYKDTTSLMSAINDIDIRYNSDWVQGAVDTYSMLPEPQVKVTKTEETRMASTAEAVKVSIKKGSKLAGANLVNKQLLIIIRRSAKQGFGGNYPAMFDSELGKRLEAFALPALVHYIAVNVTTLPQRDSVIRVCELAMEAAAKDGVEALAANIGPMLEQIAALQLEENQE